MAASPVRDGIIIKKSAKPMEIPYMVGSTSHDMAPAFLHPMTKSWGIKNKAYVWHFCRMLPGDDKGAWHSSDLWYWFGTLENCWRPMTMKDQDLSNQMTDYLTNFCKYGDPNGAGLTAWLPMGKGQKKVLRLGEGSTHMGKADLLKLTKTLLTNKAVGE